MKLADIRNAGKPAGTPWPFRRPRILPGAGNSPRQVLSVTDAGSGRFRFQLFSCQRDQVTLVRDLGVHDGDVPGALRAAGCPLRADAETILLVPRRRVLVRQIQLPTEDPEQLGRMMPYESNTASPWPREETLYAYDVMGTTGGASLVTLYLVRLEWVEEYLSRLKAQHVYPTQVEVSTRGLERMMRTIPHAGQGASLLLVADEETEYIRLAPNGPVFSRAASAGEESPDETLKRSLDIARRGGPPESRSDLLIVGGAPLPVRENGAPPLPGHVVPLESITFGATNGAAPLSPDRLLGAGAALLATSPVPTANLLPPSYRRWLEPRRLARRLPVLILLLVWLVATLAGLGYIQYESQRARAAGARARIDALGADARSLEAKNDALTLLSNERARVRRPLEIVLELYDRTPQRIAINSMRMEPGRTLVLGCEAPDFPDAFAYLGLLKESPRFTRVELITSARSHAAQESLVEFKVKCELPSTGEDRAR